MRTPDRERTAAYDTRRRHGQLRVGVTIGPAQIRALEKLSLLEVDERNKEAVGWAIEQFLDSAAHISALGDALWPHPTDDA
jgi:hypothetical protein